MNYKQYIRNVCNKFALSEDEAEMIRSLNHHFNLSQPIDEEIQKLFDDSIMPGSETEVKPNAGVLPSE